MKIIFVTMAGIFSNDSDNYYLDNGVIFDNDDDDDDN